jgi:hypothetical protein
MSFVVDLMRSIDHPTVNPVRQELLNQQEELRGALGREQALARWNWPLAD